ncbi:hypothetical protein K7432_003445 [Basidiobolus ranarum]|uniref:Uncharacterized protein n=1 Tax=Basidiobolus ranarum TaxID=34480 RepID=A0ABR2X041_9FUNG
MLLQIWNRSSVLVKSVPGKWALTRPTSIFTNTQEQHREYSSKKKKSKSGRSSKRIENAIRDVGNAFAQSQSKSSSASANWTKTKAYPFVYEPAQAPLTEVAHLAHDLDRVLFNPGVHFLQDPRSKVYNFDPYLKNILPPSEFDFDALQPYITSSKDENLRRLAIQHGKKFVGSTSSTSHLLSHMYFLTTAFKPINASVLSSSFANEPRGYTRSMKLPASVCLRLKDGVYAIDADKSFDVTDGVLIVLGKSMEKMLTLPPNEFANFHKENSWKIKDLKSTPEPYHYAKVEDFLLRAQLDCQDPRLPKQTFDLKTRAAMPIRLDKYNYLNNSIYQIKKRYGLFESFEREYFDMIRSAFLKYSIQVRIGNMDGVFVCYHNTARVFGFQYISLDEMETRLFGNPTMGEQVFNMSIKLLGRILNTATEKYPNQSLLVTVDTKETSQAMDVYVEAMNEEQGYSPSAEETVRALPVYKVKEDTKVSKWQINSYSMVNNRRVNGSFDVSSDGTDEWEFNYTLKEIKSSPSELIRQYQSVRKRQSEFYYTADDPNDKQRKKMGPQLTRLLEGLRQKQQEEEGAQVMYKPLR